MSCRCPFTGADFTFFWKIKYMTLWNELKQENISSATFYADSLYGTRWKLLLNRDLENQSFDLLLRRANQDDGPEEVQIKLSIDILNKTIPIQTMHGKQVFKFKRNVSFIFPDILTQDEIVSDSSELSSDCPLIIQCSLKDSINKMPQVCKSTTEVDLERVSFVWKTSTSTEDLRKLCVNAMSLVSQAPPLDISLYSEMKDCEKILRFTFDSKDVLGSEAHLVVVCKITLLSDEQKTGPSIQYLHSFNSDDDPTWHFPLFFKVNDLKEEFCSSLTFCFDLEFSYGKLTSRIEETKYIHRNSPSHDLSCLDSEDFLPMYKDGQFFSITLRVGDKTFPAHKDILCIRSPVFESIILEDSETKEILITDLDAETLENFLTFLYSSMSLELMQYFFCDLVGDKWTNFKKLFAAADKYEVANLKNACSIFLASNINSQNVIECMKLAELYKDNSLKVAANNYFSTYAREIINGDSFKKLLKD